MTATLTWSDIRHHLDHDTLVRDAAGRVWKRTPGAGLWRRALCRRDDQELVWWTPEDDDRIILDPPGVPEPPDGTRLEFEHQTDVYAAWRDDESSARAGWTAGDGGDVWCLYGQTVPVKWAVMWLEFGDSLRTAVRLVPHADDTGNYAKWPTAQYAVKGGAAR